MTTKVLKLTKRLYYNRVGLFILVAAIVGFGGLYLGNIFPEDEPIIHAIFTGIVGAALFAFLQVFFTSQSESELTSLTIKDTITDCWNRLDKEKRQRSKHYEPLNIYPPTESPDSLFNEDINACLQHSTKYYFRGLTGRYSVARMQQLNTRFDEVHFILPNPTAHHNYQDRLAKSSKLPTEVGIVQQETLKQMVQSICGARTIEAMSPRFEYHFIDEPIIDRYELFDDAFFVTFFSGNAEPAKYPRTYKFGNRSLWYEPIRTNFSRLVSKSAKRLSIDRETKDEEICELLQELGVSMSEADLLECQEEFNRFARNLLVSHDTPP